jgi:uncharacterized membrane protein (UPF0136 family)
VLDHRNIMACAPPILGMLLAVGPVMFFNLRVNSRKELFEGVVEGMMVGI